MDQSTYLLGGRRAKLFPLSENEWVWMTLVEISHLNILDALKVLGHVGSFGKMSQVSYLSGEDTPSDGLSLVWHNSGLGSPGECWTVGISESPNAAVVSSLSDILEGDGERPHKCYLTEEDMTKMLARYKKYGKSIPAPLAGLVTQLQSTESTFAPL